MSSTYVDILLNSSFSESHFSEYIFGNSEEPTIFFGLTLHLFVTVKILNEEVPNRIHEGNVHTAIEI